MGLCGTRTPPRRRQDATSNAAGAVVGGWDDDEGGGAAWAFTRSKSIWSRLGAKLGPSDESDAGAFGESVALSSNGLTGLIGGPGDDANVGATWDFESSGD